MQECGQKQRFIRFRKYMTILPEVKKSKQVMKDNLQFCKDLLQRRREKLQKQSQKDRQSGDLLLDAFLKCPYESEDTRAADVAMFFIAGHDTTGYQLAWCIYCWIQAPECLRKSQEEVDRVMGHHRIANSSMLKGFRYLNACFLESLRLWPVVPEGSGRTVTERLNIDGYEVPLGSEIMISNICALRSAQWGSDSQIFRPERWLDTSERAQQLRRSFTGFSYGPRACAGRTLAEQDP